MKIDETVFKEVVKTLHPELSTQEVMDVVIELTKIPLFQRVIDGTMLGSVVANPRRMLSISLTAMFMAGYRYKEQEYIAHELERLSKI